MQFNTTNKIILTTEQAFKLIKILDVKRANNYNKCSSVMMCLKCENNNEMLDVFNEFYKSNVNYDYNECVNMWNEYEVEKNIYNYNLLLLNAKKDNEHAYNVFVNTYDIFKVVKKEDKEEKIITVNVPYLLPKQKIEKCDVSKELIKFINNGIRHIGIKSAYDTGKTTLLKQICNKYNRILFISYRITLSQDLYGGFKDLGFKLYDENIGAKKIICQVDSLYKLPSSNFDLVIIDESESVFNHLNASTLDYKETVFLNIYNMCYKSKVILLDGDLSDRSKLFIKSLENEYSIIENINKKNSKKYIFHKNEFLFNKKIDEKLKEGKNLCIVSMSEKISKYYYETYKDKYKTINYTSKCDDNQKRMLCDVKKIWPNYQIVCYTPCIESGVNFDIPHFDNTFCVLSSGSTSQRGLNQMLNRVRKLRDNTIHINLNNIPCNTESYEYSIQEIETYYNNILDTDTETNKIFKKIMHYNMLEEINKCPSSFLPIFIKMITEKGHTHSFEDDTIKKVKKTNFNLIQVLESENINEEELQELNKKQQTRHLTEVDKFKLLKYYYQKTFKINFSMENKEVVEKLFNKMDMVANTRRLMGIYETSEHTNKISEIINKMYGVNIHDIINSDNIKIKKPELDNKIIEMNNYFQEHKIFFKLDKKYEITTSRQLLGKLNSILLDYGLTINKGKSHKTPSYAINIIEEIKPLINEAKIIVSKFVDIDDDLNNIKNL